ncbi:MAG TPA: hypothetical protein VGH28_29480 [Polyangiaceae bacterium]|jgi:hypothetical protein
MRPIPDDVEPVPRTATATALPDAGLRLQRTDAGSHWVAGSHTSQPEPCSDTKHRPLEARRIAPDEWIIASGVMDVIRSEEKATVAPQIDATGRTTGLVIEDVGENSCLGALGFQDGDVLRTINDVALAADWSTFPVITASVNKNGSALVRFERNGHPAAVLFEVRTE